MEVTRKNFRDSLEAVSDAIQESSFLAIDGEFTGLNHAGISHTGTFDTPEERYHNTVQGSSDFLLIQFGLCAFSYSGITKKYTARPFNFYIFPKPFSKSAPDVRFTCQSSSLDFLYSQGFDFNKLFAEGISYLRPVDEAQLRESVQMKHGISMSPAFTTPGGSSDLGVTKGPVDVPAEQREFVDNVVKKVEKFLEAGEDDHMALPSCTAFQRKLTYQTLQAKFGKEVHLQSKTGEKRERYIVVTKVKSEEALKQMETDRLTQDQAEIDAAVGFTQVVKMISQSKILSECQTDWILMRRRVTRHLIWIQTVCNGNNKVASRVLKGKLVVGHNMFLDIIHTLHQFLYPLPREYEEFKSMCRCVFPRLVDTKLMASTQPFKDRIENSSLANLHYITQMAPFQKPEVEIADGFENRYHDNEVLHEAGYDAYVTGQCFIALSNFLGQCADPKTDRVPPSSPLVEPFLNKIFMMRSLDIPYLDLTGPDLTPAREHVFHLTFPTDWKASDIHLLFSQFGNVYISWLKDTSAFVALHSKSAASSVLKTLCTKGSVYSLLSYKEYKSRQGQGSPTQHVDVEARGNQLSPDGARSRYTWTRKNDGNGSDTKIPTNNGSAVKRSHSPETTRGGPKKLKTLNADAPAFQSRITPSTTPEVTPTTTPEVTPEKEGGSWPENINSAGKKIDSGKKADKMFAEPNDW